MLYVEALTRPPVESRCAFERRALQYSCLTKVKIEEKWKIFFKISNRKFDSVRKMLVQCAVRILRIIRTYGNCVLYYSRGVFKWYKKYKILLSPWQVLFHSIFIMWSSQIFVSLNSNILSVASKVQLGAHHRKKFRRLLLVVSRAKYFRSGLGRRSPIQSKQHVSKHKWGASDWFKHQLEDIFT